jgi:hypothetical protein
MRTRFSSWRGRYAAVLAGVAVVGLASWLVGADAGQDAKEPGYDDTPFLPHSPWRVHDRKRPQPPIVDPGTGTPSSRPGAPPSDAVVLFDGKDLSQWVGGGEKGIGEDGSLDIFKAGELRTKRSFGDCQLHVEFASPAKADGGPMVWGNSGVFFVDQFELQMIESHDSHIYADGNNGAIYGQVPPLVNASRSPGEWQAYDVVFTAPRWEGDTLVKPARFTVLHNGVLVQYHQAALGPTGHRISPKYDPKAKGTEGPIRLQKHGSAVRFRNIWIRPLTLVEE